MALDRNVKENLLFNSVFSFVVFFFLQHAEELVALDGGGYVSQPFFLPRQALNGKEIKRCSVRMELKQMEQLIN